METLKHAFAKHSHLGDSSFVDVQEVCYLTLNSHPSNELFQ